ncbi:MAG: 4'-phosphopantetheinyl transferase superfamily protein [Phycisphaerae bacterium]|jgi:4'-phosphopantetheinyl transferase
MMTLTPVIVPVLHDAPTRTPQAVQQQRDAARRALAACAKRCGAPAEGWTKDDEDRPLPNQGFHWSVSHARRFAVAVIGDAPVGIDIEEIVPRDQSLYGAVAYDEEWETIDDRSWESFFRVWTAKEAALKANGVGIAELLSCRVAEIEDDLHLTVLYRGQPWRIEQYYHANHVAAVTYDDGGVEWQRME